MATKDSLNRNKYATAFATKLAAGTNTTLKGLAVDTAGFEAATALVAIGDSPETLAGGLYLKPLLLASDTTVDTDFVAVPIVDMIGGTQGVAGEIALIDAPTEDLLVYVAGYRGGKRYLRVDIVLVGAHTTGASVSATIVLGEARQSPAGATARGAALT